MITVSDIKVGDLLYTSHGTFRRVISVEDKHEYGKTFRTLKYAGGSYARARLSYQFMTIEDQNYDHKL